MLSIISALNSSRLPITRHRTLFFMDFLTQSFKYVRRMVISVETSSVERFQFSVENAYTVKYFTPKSSTTVSISSTTLLPTLCPYVRGMCLCFAHLPFPSKITATCCGIFNPNASFNVSISASFLHFPAAIFIFADNKSLKLHSTDSFLTPSSSIKMEIAALRNPIHSSMTGTIHVFTLVRQPSLYYTVRISFVFSSIALSIISTYLSVSF